VKKQTSYIGYNAHHGRARYQPILQMAVGDAREDQHRFQKPNIVGFCTMIGKKKKRNVSAMLWLIAITIDDFMKPARCSGPHLFSITEKELKIESRKTTSLERNSLISKAKICTP